MTKLIVVLLVIIGSINVYSQKKNEEAFKTETIKLISPWVFQGTKASFSKERSLESCLNLMTLSHGSLGCGPAPGVGFGARIGVNWSLFQINGGSVDRSRMVEIGNYDWDDKFTIPYVEPWPALAPGERRNITFNASGGNGRAGSPGAPGADGIAGMNGDGTYTPMPRRPAAPEARPLTTGKSYATANVREQVSSTVTGRNGQVQASAYTPVIEVKKGHMYVVHVVDVTRDFYVIIHVDDLERGEWVKLSFIKIEVPIL